MNYAGKSSRRKQLEALRKAITIEYYSGDYAGRVDKLFLEIDKALEENLSNPPTHNARELSSEYYNLNEQRSL